MLAEFRRLLKLFCHDADVFQFNFKLSAVLVYAKRDAVRDGIHHSPLTVDVDFRTNFDLIYFHDQRLPKTATGSKIFFIFCKKKLFTKMIFLLTLAQVMLTQQLVCHA